MFGSPPKLGKVQLRIMQILWQKGSATAREITDALSPAGEIAHSTVQTLLRKLEAKGAITHTQEERTFVFRPIVRQNEVTEGALQDLLQRVFNGSVSGLVAQLINNEHISAEEFVRLRELIDSAARTADANADGAAEMAAEKEQNGESPR